MSVFNQKKSVVPPPAAAAAAPNQLTSYVGKTLLLKGEVISEEEVVIDGRVEGTIHVKNRLVIGKNGFVNADIEAREVIIRGKVQGNVHGQQKVEIVPEGILNGNIFAPRVVVAEGAIFEGNIDMKAHAKKEEKTGENSSPSDPGKHIKR